MRAKPFEHPLYLEDIRRIVSLPLDWWNAEGKTFLVSGATGLIGSCLVDALMQSGQDCRIIALGRNADKAGERFSRWTESGRFRFVSHDVNEPLPFLGKIDYAIHLASCTHPLAYATKPVETVLTNVLGTANMLDYARDNGAQRFLFASSNEVYGTNRGDAELFREDYCGYIDCNTLRAGYPEGKRCAEALCRAYASQHSMDIVIPRFTRCFGPTLLPDDTKALSQFIGNALRGEDIVLKSRGDQHFSYIYVADAVSALLTILFRGESGEAYNVSNPEFCDGTLASIASMIASISGTKVVFDLPSEVEKAGFSRATKARLDPSKLRALGWEAAYDLKTGLERTIETLAYEKQ